MNEVSLEPSSAVAIAVADEALLPEAEALALRSGLSLLHPLPEQLPVSLLLYHDGEAWSLLSPGARSRKSSDKGRGAVKVNFHAGKAAHRRQYGGGKGQMVAKAVGIKAGVLPRVHDLTAGLGGDAFVLASLGCELQLVERNPVVHTLLADGLARGRAWAAEHDAELAVILNRMQLAPCQGAKQWCSQSVRADVVYLDPMFPERDKSASVKKEMAVFHELIGQDPDADELLDLALSIADYRVVVKRPRKAPFLAERPPSLSFEGKSSRFDVYTIKSLQAR